MVVFLFDNTFEGLLTAVFDAYARRTFPHMLLTEGTPQPLFIDETFQVITDREKAGRVWRGLQKKLSTTAMNCIAQCWLAEEADTPILIFRYICQAIDAPRSIETDFGNPVVLAFTRMWKRVNQEYYRLLQFIRFQKAADGTYFAAVEPEKNALPLTIGHFKDRFADQRWVIYDIRRSYGFYYDLKEVREIRFEGNGQAAHFVTGRLEEALMDKDEQLFQTLWRTYFKTVSIKERLNPRKQRNDMPVRYWKHMTECNDRPFKQATRKPSGRNTSGA